MHMTTERSQTVKGYIYSAIPTIWHSEKGKLIKNIDGLGVGEGEMNRQSTEDFQGSEMLWSCNYGYTIIILLSKERKPMNFG